MEGARDATLADIDSLVRLADLALDELNGFERGGPLLAAELADSVTAVALAEAIDDEATGVIVGEITGVVVGIALVRPEVIGERKLGRLHVFVEPEARGVGVGEVMLDRAIRWARSHSCGAIDSVALPGDRHTKNFFETFGMTARAIIVHRAL